MKKVLSLAVISFLSASALFAANPFDEFKNKLTGQLTEVAQKNLDNFAKDLGILLSGGAFHDGKTLGLPGFDIGVHAPVINVNSDNPIMKTSGLDTVALPVIQVEVGLPAKIDLIGRFISYYDSTLVGAGVRYGIIKNSVPGLPSISVQGVYNMLDVNSGQNKLKATTLSATAIASFGLPIVNPYVGVGMDSTSVEPDSTITALMPLSGMKGSASQVRIEGGINLSLIPFTYLQLGGTLVNGNLGYTAGLGLAF